MSNHEESRKIFLISENFSENIRNLVFWRYKGAEKSRIFFASAHTLVVGPIFLWENVNPSHFFRTSQDNLKNLTVSCFRLLSSPTNLVQYLMNCRFLRNRVIADFSKMIYAFYRRETNKTIKTLKNLYKIKLFSSFARLYQFNQ